VVTVKDLAISEPEDSMFSSSAAIGITAWWQLQHQHGYAPLVTRIILDKTYESPAT